MAIKGKKKSQARGSQARRRPAAAPRPVPGRSRVPWYKTDRGRLWAALAGAVLIGIVWWAVARAQSASDDLERRQGALEDYTGEIRSLLQAVRSPAEGLVAVPPDPKQAQLGSLDNALRNWVSTLRTAAKDLSTVGPPPQAAGLHPLYAQSISLYISAARTYGAAVDVGAGSVVAKGLLERAAETRDAAGSIWLSATDLLDDERAGVDLRPSFLGVPSAPAVGGGTGPTPSEPEGGGGG